MSSSTRFTSASKPCSVPTTAKQSSVSPRAFANVSCYPLPPHCTAQHAALNQVAVASSVCLFCSDHKASMGGTATTRRQEADRQPSTFYRKLLFEEGEKMRGNLARPCLRSCAPSRPPVNFTRTGFSILGKQRAAAVRATRRAFRVALLVSAIRTTSGCPARFLSGPLQLWLPCLQRPAPRRLLADQALSRGVRRERGVRVCGVCGEKRVRSKKGFATCLDAGCCDTAVPCPSSRSPVWRCSIDSDLKCLPATINS